MTLLVAIVFIISSWSVPLAALAEVASTDNTSTEIVPESSDPVVEEVPADNSTPSPATEEQPTKDTSQPTPDKANEGATNEAQPNAPPAVEPSKEDEKEDPEQPADSEQKKILRML